VEHGDRIAKVVLSHLTFRHPDLFQSKDIAWYVATDEEFLNESENSSRTNQTALRVDADALADRQGRSGMMPP